MNCCTLPFFYVAASLYVSYNSGLGPAHLVPVIFPHSENTLATVASAYLHDPAFLDCHNPDKTEPVQVADVLEHIRKILFQRNVCATVSVPVPNSWRFTREIFRQPRTLLRIPAGETHNTSPPRKFKFSQIHIKEVWIWNQSLLGRQEIILCGKALESILLFTFKIEELRMSSSQKMAGLVSKMSHVRAGTVSSAEAKWVPAQVCITNKLTLAS